MCFPGLLKLARVPRNLIHIQKHLQAIQEQIDQILRLSTSFVSVSVRISSLESVRARCCALWLVLEWTTLVLWCAGPLEELMACRQVNDPPAWCGAASTTLCGGRRPLLRGQSPLVKIGINVTVIVFTEEIWLPGSNTLRECFNNVDVGASLWQSEPRDNSSCREFASSHPSL